MRAYRKETIVRAVKFRDIRDLDGIRFDYERNSDYIIIHTSTGSIFVYKGDWIVWDETSLWSISEKEFNRQYELISSNKYKKLPAMVEWEYVGRLKGE